MARSELKNYKRWVIKVGSALLTDNGKGLNLAFVEQLAEQIAFLREQEIEVILVSSGSVAAGLSQLGLDTRPQKINQLQAAAAVGQAALVQSYEQAFQPLSIGIAQVLLTHADIANRERYLNARSTLLTLLEYGQLVIINENDTVATEEICFGDNDSLAALVVNLIDAELLVILTDQQGLFTADPRIDAQAKLIQTARADDSSLMDMASGGSSVGRGGMVTKLTAAQIASKSGAHTVIASGRELNLLVRVYAGENLGTMLTSSARMASRKQWMAGQMKVAGAFTLDEGAVNVLCSAGKSLLPVGVTEIQGEFTRGACVKCVSPDGKEVARGLSNYSSDEARLIAGKSSAEAIALLGYGGESELIHRDNMVLV